MADLHEDEYQQRKEQNQTLQKEQKGQCTSLLTNHLSGENMEVVS